MAKLLAPAPVSVGGVPAELLDLGSEVWRDPGLFRAWCSAEGVRHRPGDNWAHRFQLGRDAWAVEHGITTGASVDQERLIDEFGLVWVGSLTRSMAAAEEASDDPEEFRLRARLAPYGPHRDTLPRADPRRQ